MLPIRCLRARPPHPCPTIGMLWTQLLYAVVFAQDPPQLRPPPRHSCTTFAVWRAATGSPDAGTSLNRIRQIILGLVVVVGGSPFAHVALLDHLFGMISTVLPCQPNRERLTIFASKSRRS